MILHWSIKIENFLFAKFGSESRGACFCLCLLVFLVAAVFEYLQLLKIRLCSKQFMAVQNQHVDSSRVSRLLKSSLDCFVNVINLLLGMFIMLTIMTLNGYLIVSVLAGASIGFFLFGLNVMFCKYNHFFQATQMCNNHECSLTNANLLQNDELDQLTNTDTATIAS